MNIGQAIKEARKKAGLTQVDLAATIGITQTSLSQIEVGTINPSPKTIKAICLALNISEALLFILSVDEKDVPQGKEAMYKMLFPSIKKLALDIISNENTEKPDTI